MWCRGGRGSFTEGNKWEQGWTPQVSGGVRKVPGLALAWVYRMLLGGDPGGSDVAMDVPVIGGCFG